MEDQAEQHLKWWLKNKQLLSISIKSIIAILIPFALLVYWFGWDWTGFNSGASKITITSISKGITTTTELQPAKSLWDWLQLLGILAIPVVAVVGAAWYTQIQQQRDKRLEHAQHNHERQLANKQAESDRTAADKRAKTELKIADDYQREAALQAYINAMSELLLEKKLRRSQPNDEVRKIARIRTLTVLHRLDGKRQRSVLQFLYESDLIKKGDCIIDLKGVDLSKSDLRRGNLREADLRGVILCGADFTKAILCGADLRGVNFTKATLCEADLSESILRGADLSGADLTKTILCYAVLTQAEDPKTYDERSPIREAILQDAILNYADLTNASVTDEQLARVKSLKGATLRNGLINY